MFTKLRLYGVVALFAFVIGGLGGYTLHRKLYPNNQLQPTSQASLIASLTEQLAGRTAEVAKITGQSRAALDSFARYRKLYKDLQKHEEIALADLRTAAHDTAVTKDSLVHQCSLIVLDCQHRAAVADSVAEDLRGRLKAQTGLQASLCGIGITSGPTFTTDDKKAHLLGVTAGFDCRIPIHKIFKLF